MANSARAKLPKSKTTSPSKAQPAKAGGKKTEARKAKAKAPSPPPAAAEDEEDEESGSVDSEAALVEEEESEEEVLLQGFSSESDSSDEEDGVDAAPVDVSKLPTVARDDASVKRKLEKAKKQPVRSCRVFSILFDCIADATMRRRRTEVCCISATSRMDSSKIR